MASTVRWMPVRSGSHHRQLSIATGSPHQGAENIDGVVLERPTKKSSGCVGHKSGGPHVRRDEIFLSQLARARARQEIPLMRKRAEQAWMRWGAIVSCTLARAVASSLLNVQSPVGADGDTPPTHEVERDHRCSGLVP